MTQPHAHASDHSPPGLEGSGKGTSTEFSGGDFPSYRCPKCGNVSKGSIVFTHTSNTDGDKSARFCLRCFIDFLIEAGVPQTERVGG